jgi:hypothetical protein
MNLSGNAKIATEFGVNSAIFIQSIAQWIFINFAKNQNIKDGHCWTYNSLEAWEALLPWWNVRQLETIIKNALKQGLIIKANHNKNKYDRTTWYALSHKALAYYPELTTERNLKLMAESISPNCEISGYQWNEALSREDNESTHFTNLWQAFHNNVAPIPTSKPTKSFNNKKTLLKDAKVSSSEKEIILANNPHNLPEDKINDYLLMRKKQRKPVTKTGWQETTDNLTEIWEKAKVPPAKALARMIEAGWSRLDISFFQDKEAKNNKAKEDLSDAKSKDWS